MSKYFRPRVVGFEGGFFCVSRCGLGVRYEQPEVERGAVLFWRMGGMVFGACRCGVILCGVGSNPR